MDLTKASSARYGNSIVSGMEGDPGQWLIMAKVDKREKSKSNHLFQSSAGKALKRESHSLIKKQQPQTCVQLSVPLWCHWKGCPSFSCFEVMGASYSNNPIWLSSGYYTDALETLHWCGVFPEEPVCWFSAPACIAMASVPAGFCVCRQHAWAFDSYSQDKSL